MKKFASVFLDERILPVEKFQISPLDMAIIQTKRFRKNTQLIAKVISIISLVKKYGFFCFRQI